MATKPFVIETVAIVGAGPSGIATAKYLLSEGKFSKISIFEQRSHVGGIWNTDFRSSSVDVAAFPSPIYEGMESNIPSEIMQYHNRPFPKDDPLLPDAGHVLDYLRGYAEDMCPQVDLKLRHEVKDVGRSDEDNNKEWVLRIQNLDMDQTIKEYYDAVVIANGRYNKAYEPSVPGLDSWKRAYPDSVFHSKFYRNARKFKNKKVVIVGFSSSGVDIANAIEPVCSNPLLISQKSAEGLSPGSKGFNEGKTMLPEIIEFRFGSRSVIFANGKEESEVDYVIFCTGYDYDYPFLSSLSGFQGDDADGNTNTYQHIFHVDFPSLAFVMLPLRVVAFPFAETQSAVIARVWSGRLSLPTVQAMVDWVKQNKERRGSGKAFHKLSYPADAQYMTDMYHWCQHAKDEESGMYLAPPVWGEREKWLRRMLHDIRRATEARGEERFAVKTVADAGFCFGKDEM